ncbi:MAG: LAGLIDADG family homing endonuclease, partial [Candidatus Aenigmatarchaeota archaeon]
MSLQIWTEKYRPSKLADVVNQKHVVGRLEAWVKEKSIPNMIFAGPAGTGKCVTPETPILLPDNTVLSIEEAFKKDVKEVLTLGSNGKISKGKVKYFYKTKKDRLLKVKTKSGCYVVATPEHPFLILSRGSPKWVEAKDIKENSLLATPLRIPFFQTTKSVKIDWKKVPNIWARLECEVPIEKHKLQEGKQATVMEALDSDFRTCKEIAKMAGVSPETASWALRAFHKKHLIAKKKRRPARFALNHRFTRTKTVPLKEVKNENKIVKIFHKGKFHVPSYEIKYFKFITPALMEWAAMILADGNIRESSIRFYNKNHKMLSRFKELTFENLGKDVKWQMRERLGVPYFELLSGTAPKLLRYFFNAPADTKKSDMVEMPMSFMVRKNLISAFLRGYYQCDGYFSSQKGLIEITSASEKMIYQFKHLLLPFGIASRAFRKKKQHYLHITGWKNILRFKELVNPDIKVISYGSSGSTNVDVMEIDVGALKHVLSSLGIRRQDIGEEREIEHIFERGRGGRERVQWIYGRICDLSREKIAKALECISVLNALECSVDSKTLEEDMNKVLRWMNNSQRRKLLENSTKIRSDALKIYHDGRRKPGIDNFLAILQSLRGLKVTGMEKTYSRLINLLLLRRTVMEAMEELGVSFNEIACTLETNSSNIAHYVQSDRLTVQSICTLPMIMKQVKMSIEERVLSEELIEHLSTLQFLSTCEIKW